MDNFCDPCAFLHTNPLPKRGLLCRERICSLWKQVLSLRSGPVFRRVKMTELPSLKAFLLPFKCTQSICQMHSVYMLCIVQTGSVYIFYERSRGVEAEEGLMHLCSQIFSSASVNYVSRRRRPRPDCAHAHTFVSLI